MKNEPEWRLVENEWDVTEQLRVAAWLPKAGVRIGVEGRYLEDQPPSMTIGEAKRLVRKLEAAIAWAERAAERAKGAA
jgi:hypothetical protein